MRYITKVVVLVCLFTAAISCTNNSFETHQIATVEKIKVKDGRIAFSDYDSFYNFSKLDNESRASQLNDLIESSDSKFQKSSLKFTSKDEEDYIITSDLLRSIANDDNMYQIGNLIYLETYDYQFITNENNIHLLFDSEYLQSKVNTNSKIKDNSTNEDMSISEITNTDVYVYPIQRTEFAELEPCNPDIYKTKADYSKTSDDIIPCDPGQGEPGGGSGQTIEDIDYSDTGENQKYVYFANGGRFRVLFKAKAAKFSNVYSANAYMKLEENNNILFFDNWRERDADSMTFTSASINITLKNRENNTRITRSGFFPQSSNTNQAVLSSNTADIAIPPDYEFETVNFGHVIGTISRLEDNILYVISRRVNFE